MIACVANKLCFLIQSTAGFKYIQQCYKTHSVQM